MATLYGNFLNGTITDAPLTIGATTANSAEFANLPAVADPDTMWLVLDPEGASGAPEIVQVTAHTAAATSVTIVRGQQSTTAREHAAATVWRCALTKSDADGFLTSDDLANYATTAYADALGSVGFTADTIMRRDANGRSRIANPSDAADIANKGYVDSPSSGTLANGTIRYAKNAGIVHVVTLLAGWDMTAATLPVGFRPAVAIGGSAFGLDGGVNFVDRLEIATSGAISLDFSGGAGVDRANFSISFAAA